MSAGLAPLSLQGNLSRTLAVDDAFDPRAQQRLSLTGFLRIGVDPAGAVTVMGVAGTALGQQSSPKPLKAESSPGNTTARCTSVVTKSSVYFDASKAIAATSLDSRSLA